MCSSGSGVFSLRGEAWASGGREDESDTRTPTTYRQVAPLLPRRKALGFPGFIRQRFPFSGREFCVSKYSLYLTIVFTVIMSSTLSDSIMGRTRTHGAYHI